MPLFEMSYFTLALMLLLAPRLFVRLRRMGPIGMLVPMACPPARTESRDKVKCCTHNPCPDRPAALAVHETQPWRCPQCSQWWIVKATDTGFFSEPYRHWTRVSLAAGDGFIEELL